MERLVKFMAILSTGLLAGAFAYAFFTVVPTFYDVPLEVHLTFRNALMRHNSAYVQSIMALSFVTSIWLAWSLRASNSARTLALSASVLVLITFLVTRFGNVPINQMMRTWSVATLPQDYQQLLARWLVFHNVRMVTAVSSFLCVVIAATTQKKR